MRLNEDICDAMGLPWCAPVRRRKAELKQVCVPLRAAEGRCGPLITSLITNCLLRQVDLITSLITNWLLRQVDGQKVWVVKDVKLEPMCGGEGQQRDESPDDLSRSNQAPYRASRGQPVGPLPAPHLRDAQDGALQQAGDARDGAQRRRQRVSSLVTSPRMRNLIR